MENVILQQNIMIINTWKCTILLLKIPEVNSICEIHKESSSDNSRLGHIWVLGTFPAVWPDWAILKALWDKDIEKEAQILGDFLVNFVNYKILRLLFATFVQKLGYFLFQHLVTLIPHQKMNRNRRKDRASDSQRLSYLAALGSIPAADSFFLRTIAINITPTKQRFKYLLPR